MGNNLPSSKPFWQRINKIKGKKTTKPIPTLLVDGKRYETDEQKSELFAKNLKKTFSLGDDVLFDGTFKAKVENRIKNHDFSKHNYCNKELFDIKDLNKASGEDNINNKMIQNTTPEFREMILHLINTTVNQSINFNYTTIILKAFERN